MVFGALFILVFYNVILTKILGDFFFKLENVQVRSLSGKHFVVLESK